MNFGKLAACLLWPLALTTQPAQAAWTGATNAWLANPSVFAYGMADIGSRYAYDASAVELQGNRTFEGIDGSGNLASMSFSYASMAQATANALKARASATLADGFYNRENPAYMLGFTPWFAPDINPAGVPTYLESSATAFYQQRVAVSGASNLAYITVDVRVDGWSSGPTGGVTATWAGLDFRNGEFVPLNQPTVDQSFNSGRIDVVNGVASVEIMLLTSVRFNLDGQAGFIAPLLEGAVDFSHTATIGTLYGFDDAGRPVDLASATVAGGQSFITYRTGSVPAVPEPGSMALLACGLGLIAWRRRSAARSA